MSNRVAIETRSTSYSFVVVVCLRSLVVIVAFFLLFFAFFSACVRAWVRACVRACVCV